MIETARSILVEIDRVLSGVDQGEVDALCAAILGANTTVVYGLGRRGIGHARLCDAPDALGAAHSCWSAT